MQRSLFGLIGIVSIATTCGTGNKAVNPDEMSADQHREEAERERRKAGDQRKQYRPSAERTVVMPDKAGVIFDHPVYNRTDVHLAHAATMEKHARQHEAAAKYLQKFEEGECVQFAPAIRASCPLLGPVIRIDNIPGGVRVWLAPGVSPDAVVAHMRCHYAYARTRAFENTTCALYVRGIEIRRGHDPATIEIVSPAPAGEQEIRARSREESLLINGKG